MAITYEPIATTTLGSAAASVSFTSISSTFTDLVLIANTGSTVSAVTIVLQFNGDTGSNYSDTSIYGSGSAAGSSRLSNTSNIYMGYLTSGGAVIDQTTIISINNYANTTTYKTAISRKNDTGYVEACVGLWRNTAAINRVDVICSGSTFRTGSTFTLYGIKAA